ncbi:tape measure protein [Ruania rhizosphaerae]|uniref:tape measure protein n=1 Tax=Ruania rhizosphaerae TaxID=1840413 RepID=UPI0013598031|nr:tape measure protein [Ruania rhizosphaerae]
MAEQRSVVVRLVAQISEFTRAMGQASRSVEEVGSATERTSQRSQTAVRSIVQSARENEQAWTTAGAGLTAFGAGITAAGVAAGRTGIAYNTLQQRSRAALTTMLGSAEQVAAQMAEFDEFARQSPFARDVWLQAQQQMLGFGIEAQRVIPYLDAIENGVAAAGGSNHDVAELSRIFSQISASAKITATDLREFGNRGIDAATLIGSQMGMTGAEIRESITDGTLDAQDALDALAAGMQERFSGAADNVKDTMVGAVDRVKAAFRDLSSELVTVLVDPEGGGLLVDWLNNLADAARGFQDLPGPLKATVAGIIGLTGAASLLAGGALLAVPRMVAFYDALGNLGPAGTRAQAGLRRFGPTLGRIAIRAAAVAVAVQAAGAASRALSDAMYGGAAGANELSRALRTGDYDTAFQGLSGAYDSLGESLQTLTGGGIIDRADRALSGLNQAVGGPFVDDVQGARDAFAAMSDSLSGMVQGGDAEQAAAQFEMLADRAAEMGVTQEQLLELMPSYRDALVGLEEGAYDAAGGSDTLAASQEAAQEQAEEWAGTAQSAGESFGSIVGSYQSVIDKNREIAESTSAATEDASDSWEDFYDGASVSMQDWIAELEAQREATENWAANYREALGQIADEVPRAGQEAHRAFVEEMVASGEEGAAALQAFVDGTPEQRQQLVDAWAGTGQAISDVIDRGTRPIGLDADTSEAVSEFNAMTGDWENTTTPTGLDADTTDADDTVAEWQRTMMDDVTDTNLDANTRPADDSVREAQNDWANDTTDTQLGANTSPAWLDVNGFLDSTSDRGTDVQVGANTYSARQGVDYLVRDINGRSATISVYTRRVRGGGSDSALGRLPEGYATGGAISGPGSGTSDSVPIMASNGEHMLTAREVQMAGGHSAIEAMRAEIRSGRRMRAYATGGPVSRTFLPTAPSAPTVNVAAPSLDGMAITGRLEISGDGLARIVDGRIGSALTQQADSYRYAGRP